MLTDKLTMEQQEELLGGLFGFAFEEDDENHRVLYDEEGNQFYSDSKNYKFDFSTLAGIFSYTAYRSKEQGHNDCQFAMRKSLGIH